MAQFKVVYEPFGVDFARKVIGLDGLNENWARCILARGTPKNLGLPICEQ
jgi:hypothetical protein